MKLLKLAATLLCFSHPVLANPGALPTPDGDALIIDVRTANEYQQKHVQQAVNIPYDEIASRITTLAPDRSTRIILYCRSGHRSGIAAQTLREMGYQQINNRGGLSDMQRSGYPIN